MYCFILNFLFGKYLFNNQSVSLIFDYNINIDISDIFIVVNLNNYNEDDDDDDDEGDYVDYDDYEDDSYYSEDNYAN